MHIEVHLAVRKLLTLGPGAEMSTFDVESAYRVHQRIGNDVESGPFGMIMRPALKIFTALAALQ